MSKKQNSNKDNNVSAGEIILKFEKVSFEFGHNKPILEEVDFIKDLFHVHSLNMRFILSRKIYFHCKKISLNKEIFFFLKVRNTFKCLQLND